MLLVRYFISVKVQQKSCNKKGYESCTCEEYFVETEQTTSCLRHKLFVEGFVTARAHIPGLPRQSRLFQRPMTATRLSSRPMRAAPTEKHQRRACLFGWRGCPSFQAG